MPPLLTHWFTTGQAGQLHAAGGGGDDVGAKAGPPHPAGSGGGDDAPDAGRTDVIPAACVWLAHPRARVGITARVARVRSARRRVRAGATVRVAYLRLACRCSGAASVACARLARIRCVVAPTATG